MESKQHSQGRKVSQNRNKTVSAMVRWLHIYVSMLGLLALLFFSITGITVNHPDWFAGMESFQTYEGMITRDWLPEGAEAPEINQLAIVEFFRDTHGIGGSLSEFSIDEYQCIVGFNGPAYTAYATIERESGHYTLDETAMGLVALMNDLHKGRDTGTAWSWVIDISAGIMILASLSGLYLLLGLRKRKGMGLLAALAGGLLFMFIYLVFVP